MLGYLLRHDRFGYGKVIEVRPDRLTVAFAETGQETCFTQASLAQGMMQRATLRIDDAAIGPNGRCIINRVPPPGREKQANALEYGVTYVDGLRATVSEIELTPIGSRHVETLVGRLAGYRPHQFVEFRARERLIRTMAKVSRQAGGLRALLSSRFDLRPHQAFVSGTVIMDHRRRYILADEVGLGKTIEAGVIIHDLLASNPAARVLVLTPGTLTRQWLCELHSGFGGQGFRLADLHEVDAIDLKGWRKVICSTGLALKGLDEALRVIRWDVVVVDEAHHLLDAPLMYAFVQSLSTTARDLLLLSAVPARRRETELFKLLALLEPDRFCKGSATEAEFLALYGAQELIGRRLNRLSNEIEAVSAGEAEVGDALDMAERLASVPTVEGDARVAALLLEGRQNPTHGLAAAKAIRQHIIDEYRISRRILRNRRQRLVAQQQIADIKRRLSEHIINGDSLEQEAVEAVLTLLQETIRSGLRQDLARPLGRLLLQALAESDALVTVLRALANPPAGRVNEFGIEWVNFASGAGYDAWDEVLRIVAAGVREHLPGATLSSALKRAVAWQASTSSNGRLEALLDLLRPRRTDRRKLLVFAGFPGVARRLGAHLRLAFSDAEVAEFRHDLTDAEKEDSVRRFRQDSSLWIMVSDETGGEGRNFQFADSLVHYDLPWLVSAVEQRIGRLDRLGREAFSSEVMSHVLVNPEAPEAGLLACYRDGLGIFSASISGLEFSLREIQDHLVEAAVNEDREALAALAPKLAAAAADERLRDESEALLDEGSFQAATASRFRQEPDPALEQELEEAFVNYYQLTSRSKAVRRWPDERTPDGLWRFKPDDMRDGPLEIADKNQQGELNPRTGTFRREIARARRDMEFFTWGNPLFDAVAASLTGRTTARTYAIEARHPDHPKIFGIEVVVTPCPALRGLEGHPGLQELAKALFGVRRKSASFSIVAKGDASALTKLRNDLSLRDRGSLWRDMSPERLCSLIEAVGVDWTAFIADCEAQALRRASKAFVAELDEVISAEHRRVEEALGRTRSAPAAEEAELLQRYVRALTDWTPVVDGLGVAANNWVLS